MRNNLNEAYLKAFGKHLRKVRMAKKIGLRELAGIAEIDYGLLSKIERGAVSTTINTVHVLATTLEVKEKELFDF